MTTILAEEEKGKEGKNLLEMLWKMGEVRRCWNEGGGVGGVRVMNRTRCSIFGFQMNWLGLNRTDRMIRLVSVDVEKIGRAHV